MRLRKLADEAFNNGFTDLFSGNIADYVHFGDLIFIFVVLVATLIISKIVDRLLKNQFKVISQKLKVDETIYRIFRHVTVALVYLLGIILIITRIPALQNLSLALFAGAGFAGIVVGLAAQTTLSNIISGLSLALFRPFRVGDKVNIRDEYGRITDITLRHTVVKTWDNRRLIIPNHIISDDAIINWSIEDPTVCWPVDIGISYDSNIDLARKIMIEVTKRHYNVMTYPQIRKHDDSMREGEEVTVRLIELGDFSVNLRLYFWVEDRSIAYTTGCDIREAIKKRFDAEGIEIPFPYRTIVYKNDLVEKEEKSIGEKAS